jgi:HEPN domain-containing protein
MQPEGDRWRERAREDLTMARLAYDARILNQVCFHAQQAVEKWLKAVVVDRGEPAPRTHKIADLLALDELNAIPAELRLRLVRLDRFYIPTRYPDALPGSLAAGGPAFDDAREALSTVESLMES